MSQEKFQNLSILGMENEICNNIYNISIRNVILY